MAKGMRLKFLGHTLTPEEMSMLASCLGRNTHPHFSGWGSAGCRNYLAFESGHSFDICKGLASRGIMRFESPDKTGQGYTYFHATDLGCRIFDLFRRHHKRPRLNLWAGHPRNKKRA